MKLGLGNKEDRNKTILFGALLVGAAYSLYTNVFSGEPNVPQGKPAAVSTPETGAATALTGNSAPPPALRRGMGGRAGEFRPKLRGLRPEDHVDASKVDPTLKLNLLTRVQSAAMEGGARNIFAFGAAAPVAASGPIPNVPKVQFAVKPPLAPVIPLGPGQPPPPPPIPFKYYGYASVKGEARKRAFFLDGEDILAAWEGDMIKDRYRVVHIGLTSVEMEDTQFKNKQSLPLAEDLAG